MKRIIGLLCSVLLLGITAQGRELPRKLTDEMDAMIVRELDAKAYPGAALVIGDRNGILYSRNYGYHDYTHKQPVTDNDLYDMASCTKVMSTTFTIMYLYDQGLVSLDETVERTLPEFAGTPVGTVTVRELLTHTSGLRPQSFYQYLVRNADGGKLFSGTKSESYPYPVEKRLFIAKNIAYDTSYISRTFREGYRKMGNDLYINPAFDTVIHNRILKIYDGARRGKYNYDDTNFYLLKRIAETKSGSTLDALTRILYDRLKCRNTGYNPLQWHDPQEIIPTENDVILRRGVVQGYVHDELGAMMGGVGGNAGLFATASDVGTFCEMLLNKGKYGDRQILKSETVDLFTSSPCIRQAVYRGLGFDKRAPESDLGGDYRCGHTGYTGTFFWMDMKNGYYLVFLSNRVHPTRINNKLSSSELRSKLWLKLSEYFGGDCL